MRDLDLKPGELCRLCRSTRTNENRDLPVLVGEIGTESVLCEVDDGQVCVLTGVDEEGLCTIILPGNKIGWVYSSEIKRL